jgi:hypothetical protein
MCSVQRFYELKNTKDEILETSFVRKMNGICKKYGTLSKNNVYIKVQKVQFIDKPKDNENIVHILNKLSTSNYEQIRTKIFLKLVGTNANAFQEQILHYSSRSQINSLNLHRLMNDIGLESSLTHKTQNIYPKMIQMYDNYIDEFVESFGCFLQTSTAGNGYVDFIKQNEFNNHVRSKCQFICEFLFDAKCVYVDREERKFDVLKFYTILCDKLVILFDESVEENETQIYMLLECIKTISEKDIRCLKTNVMTAQFINRVRGCEKTHNLPNKLRFKLMDIYDLLNLSS